MNMDDREVGINVLVAGQEHTWALDAARQAREWLLTLRGGDRTWSAEGPDLFEALRTLRAKLDKEEILLGCNGARPNAWASGMQRDMGVGKTVYLCELDRGGRPPEVRTLDAAPLDEAGTVREQDEFHARWLASRDKAG
jgi:hypothetical protein